MTENRMDTTDPHFPSTAHQTLLQRRVLAVSSTPSSELSADKIGYSSFTDPEKWEYHAYDYAWRRHFLNQDDQSSPIDRRGEWHDPRMIGRVMRMLYPLHRKVERITPADEAEARGDHERAVRYRAQDRARAAAMALIEGDGKLPDGRWSPASQAFVTLCAQQARENLAEFEARQQRQAGVYRRYANAAIPSLAEQLGVRATERPSPAGA